MNMKSFFSTRITFFIVIGFANYLSTFAERLELEEYTTDVDDGQKALGLVLKNK